MGNGNWENGLTLEFVAVNKKIINFLDITLNLETGHFMSQT